jgi:AcrR family transcriptional regulator
MSRSSGVASAGLRAERRRQQALLSQNHLLDAAEVVFAEKGFAGATIREIADAAEFSAGAVYNFFEGKADLFAAVMSRRNEEILSLMGDAVSTDRPATERLHAMVDVCVAYYLQHHHFYRLFQRAIGGAWINMKASFNEKNYRQYQEVLALEARVFADGVASGEFRDEDPATMAALFAGIVQAYLEQCIVSRGKNGKVDTDHYPRPQLVALIDRAFLREP